MDFSFRRILNTVKDAAGAILANVGDAFETAGTEAEIYGTAGLVARPPDAQAGDGAECITVPYSGGELVIAMRDLRGTEILGNLLQGETCVYAPGNGQDNADKAPTVMLKNNGTKRSANMIVPDDDGKTVIVNVNNSTGAQVMIRNAKASFFINQDGSFAMTGNGCGISFDADGNLVITAKSVQIGGQNCLIGNNPAAEPVMLSTQLLAWIAQVNTALGVIAGAQGLPTNPTIVPPVAVPMPSTTVLGG